MCIRDRDNGGNKASEIICKAVTKQTPEDFNTILDIVSASGGLSYSYTQAKREVELAKKALVHLPESKYKQVMLDLADFSIARVS